ncbi:MAG: universal stress protein [Acidobacteria bacterium]|nr:universal stress protein [Acidobacteriota bacterium]
MSDPRLRNILFTTDFSEAAEAALPYASALAAMSGAILHVFHAVTPHAYDPQRIADEFASLARFFEAEEDQARNKLAGSSGAAAGGRVRTIQATRRGFSVPSMIMDYVAEQAIDLLVMSTHGRRSLEQVVFGSVAEAVLRRCPCPAWLVRQGMRPCLTSDGRDLHLDHVLIPTDFSSNSVRPMSWLPLIRGNSAPHIHLLHAVEARFHPAYYAGGVDSVFELDPEARGRMEAKIRRLFALPDAGASGVTIALREGAPPATIVDYITEASIDLVVLSNNGYDEVEDYVVGSTTERVIRRSTVPVLVV